MERKIARGKVTNNQLWRETGKRKIDCPTGRQVVEAVPAKAVRPIALPDRLFTLLNIQVGNMHLKGIFVFGEQEHSSAA